MQYVLNADWKSDIMEEPREDYPSGGTINRYVNILMDKWFKRILGAESHKQTLLALLRELIPEREIVDISYNRQRKKSPIDDGHGAIFDVECTDAGGCRFVVEMQQHKQVHFAERALFYSTFPLQEQVKAQHKGAKQTSHDVQFDYPPVYVISFLNFSLHKDSNQVLFRYDLRERNTGELMTDRINYLFLEMANYRKAEPSAQDSFCEKLAYALTHMSILNARPPELVEEVFGLLFAACEVTRLSEQEQNIYTEDIMTTELDRRNILYTARLEGLEEGREEGRKEGRKEGREEGRKEGRTQERAKNAARLKNLGIPIETIAEALELSAEEIKALSLS